MLLACLSNHRFPPFNSLSFPLSRLSLSLSPQPLSRLAHFYGLAASALPSIASHLGAAGDLDGILGLVLGLGAHAALNLARHRQEGLLDIAGVLRAGLKERDAERVGKLLGGRKLNNLLVHKIALVADKKLVHVLIRVAVNLLKPLLHVVERLLVSNIIHDNDAVGAAVVRRGDGAEALLAGSVPLKTETRSVKRKKEKYDRGKVAMTYNLELHRLAIKLNGADLEINTNGRDVAFRVRVVLRAEAR